MATQSTTLVRTFVDLADTLVAEFDLVDFFTMLATRCIELFDVDEIGVLLADAHGNLHVTGSSSHNMRCLELFELQHDEGPCPDSFRSATLITCPDLSSARARWPRFAPAALAVGMQSAHAVPLRLRGTVLGALNLLAARTGPLDDDDLVNAQALADVATIALIQHRAASEARLLNEQLQHALQSRVVIEQAKGYVRNNRDVDMETAFTLLRSYARSHNRRLNDVASAILDMSLSCSELGPVPTHKGSA